MSEISIRDISRRFGAIQALDGISLDFPAGSFTALLGPSGCGKSTLLRLVAGFEAPDAGSIRFGSQLVADPVRQVRPEKRGVGMVFQSYALWPHMDVAGNVSYPLRTRGLEKGTIEQKVADVLAMVGLTGLGARKVDELSGGQRQRVALARCIVADAGIILFDEPLANLDIHLRATMVDVFGDIHRATGATIVYVTHDQGEALALADRIAVLDRGRLLQVGSPIEIYRAPVHVNVAGFVGRGAIVNGQAVDHRDDLAVVEISGLRIEARGAGIKSGPVRILLRPEALALAHAGLPAVVKSSTYRGPVHELRLSLGTGEEILLDDPQAHVVGEHVHVAISDAWVIPDA
ncbi:iron(III) transport system ATP-binding protein [Mesorhizobium soli]|uniref:ABC transporter ATP-binding protein n=1 Tax=Pseudaminobacter soli (ex Li et al. 2025) TaxID=1295366 RepID=UPI002475064B|nr:ABC transporter ATP-binding protein [Mesorhizobium soli]MDH6233814.1 iron(III) transport system ATP-binding protein [Mesorhizobium soli]